MVWFWIGWGVLNVVVLSIIGEHLWAIHRQKRDHAQGDHRYCGPALHS
jgi:hypothetical protein